MSLGQRWRALCIAAVIVVGACGSKDGVFDIEVRSCVSPRGEPVAYGVFYSIDGEEQTCYVQTCLEETLDGCLIGALAPEVPSGALLEMQVALYEPGPTPAACSPRVTQTVDSDTSFELELSCDAQAVAACPLPVGCTGGI